MHTSIEVYTRVNRVGLSLILLGPDLLTLHNDTFTHLNNRDFINSMPCVIRVEGQ